MEPSMEHVFSVEAMVHGYYEYKNAWDTSISEMLRCEREVGNIHNTFVVAIKDQKFAYACVKLAEEIPEDGIFLLNSPFRSGRGCLPVVLNLKYFNNTIHAAHTYAYHIYSNH